MEGSFTEEQLISAARYSLLDQKANYLTQTTVEQIYIDAYVNCLKAFLGENRNDGLYLPRGIKRYIAESTIIYDGY